MMEFQDSVFEVFYQTDGVTRLYFHILHMDDKNTIHKDSRLKTLVDYHCMHGLEGSQICTSLMNTGKGELTGLDVSFLLHLGKHY